MGMIASPLTPWYEERSLMGEEMDEHEHGECEDDVDAVNGMSASSTGRSLFRLVRCARKTVAKEQSARADIRVQARGEQLGVPRR